MFNMRDRLQEQNKSIQQFLGNTTFQKIVQEHPNSLEEATDFWLKTYSLAQLKDKNNSEHKARWIGIANYNLKNYYEELKLNHKFEENPLEQIAKLVPLEITEVYKQIEEKHPEVFDEAFEMWTNTYEQTRVKSYKKNSETGEDEDVMKHYRDNSAADFADKTVREFYIKYLKGIMYENHKDERVNTELKAEEFKKFIDSDTLARIEFKHPEKLQEALDDWVYNYGKIQIVKLPVEEYIDRIGVRSANRRLKYFLKKLD